MGLNKDWDLPSAGSILLARDGESVRPCIVLAGYKSKSGAELLTVVLGSSQQALSKNQKLFVIDKNLPKDVWRASGLCFTTGFDLTRKYTVVYDSKGFVVPKRPKFGLQPILGTVHPAIIESLKKGLED